MFLNIITPCCRPENLHTISKSINIPQTNYRWLVVFDMDNFPSNELIPDNCEIYLHRDVNSVAGHSQRNSVLNIISSGHVYMNDDDTIIHSSLWDEIKKQKGIRGNKKITSELIQIGAMVVRYLDNLCD